MKTAPIEPNPIEAAICRHSVQIDALVSISEKLSPPRKLGHNGAEATSLWNDFDNKSVVDPWGNWNQWDQFHDFNNR
jgi:hypothetical protein